jgi:hypothetical protein
MAALGGNPPDWRFFQVFGEEQPEGTGVEDIQEGVLADSQRAVWNCHPARAGWL